MDSMTRVDRETTQVSENFDRLGTVGIEEEFFVVDAAGRPVPMADRLIEANGAPPRLQGRLDREMYQCIVETKTPTCDDFAAVSREVKRLREALADHAARFGYEIAAAGVHPALHPNTGAVSSKPRYRDILDRIRRPQWRNTTAGLHVHVGVDDPDRAIWIANELRWHLPVLLALSANSPFHDGVDTGLASARASVFGCLPNTGIPTSFESYEAFVRFEEAMLRTASIDDRGQLWWDVRPRPSLGTVEIRAPDAHREAEVVLTLAAYVRALVRDLAERHADGESSSDLRKEFLEENKWRALRYGHDASFIDRDGRDEVTLAEVVDRDSDRLGVDGLHDLLERESGATMQRRCYAEGGTPAVCNALRLPECGTDPRRDTVEPSEGALANGSRPPSPASVGSGARSH